MEGLIRNVVHTFWKLWPRTTAVVNDHGDDHGRSRAFRWAAVIGRRAQTCDRACDRVHDHGDDRGRDRACDRGYSVTCYAFVGNTPLSSPSVVILLCPQLEFVET